MSSVPKKSDRQLLWAEEFDFPNGLNPKNWSFDLGDGTEKGIPGWGNNEREYYTEDSVDTDNGLTITAQRTDIHHAPEAYYGPAEWTSGKIHTAGKLGFKYGYFEFKAKMPAGGGTWPAIWMLGESISEIPWPTCGEIDIFEGAGNRPLVVQGTLHGPGYSADKGITTTISQTKELSEDFHTIGLLWQENRIEWFFDDISYFTLDTDHPQFKDSDWVFNNPFYLIINLAMGGWFAGDIAPDLHSANLQVKSIHFYSIDGVGELIRHK